jgi:hypothetical protein
MELPPYISWSRINAFKTNPQEYYRRYILNEKMFETKWLKYGKAFADAVEAGKSDDDIIDTMVNEVETYKNVEKEVEAKTDDLPLKLYGFIDTHKEGAFREYKTGTAKWTQNRVDNHGQLLMYATMEYLNTGEIPEVHLDWLPVEELTDGSLSFTGEIYSFERVITEPEIESFLDEVKQLIEEIEEYEPKDEFDLYELPEDKQDLYNEYLEIQRKENQLAEKKNDIKEKLEDYMVAEGLQKITSSDGTFYQHTTKNYTYPDSVSEKENEIKDSMKDSRSEIKKMKKEAEKSGEATLEETKSIRFRSK